MNHRRTGTVLAVLGFLIILVILKWGVPSAAFDSLSAIYLRIGFLYVFLGVAITVSHTMNFARAIAFVTITLVATFLVGLAIEISLLIEVYPNSVDFKPPLWPKHLVAAQATVTLGLTPVPVGFLAGILEWRNRRDEVRMAWIASVLLSVIVGFAWVVARNYFGIVVMYFTFSAVLGALPPLLLTRGMDGREWIVEPIRSRA